MIRINRHYKNPNNLKYCTTVHWRWQCQHENVVIEVKSEKLKSFPALQKPKLTHLMSYNIIKSSFNVFHEHFHINNIFIICRDLVHKVFRMKFLIGLNEKKIDQWKSVLHVVTLSKSFRKIFTFKDYSFIVLLWIP